MSDTTGLLDRVAERIPVPGDALEQLGRRRHSRNRARRITAGLLALAITIAGGARAWMTFGSARTQRPITPIVADTYVRFPAAAAVRHDRLGRLQIVIRTNLPEGTVAVFSVTDGDTVTTQRVSVVDGRLSLTTSNRGCRLRYRQAARPVAVHMVVGPRPNMMTLCGQGSGGCNSRQPVSVYRALGRRFERLHGAQVTETGEGNYISLSRGYVLPTSTCHPSAPAASIRRLLPFFPQPGVGRTCCDTAQKAAVQYASAVLNWKIPTLESGGCFAGPPLSCPDGPTTQTFLVHDGCLTCTAVTIRTDRVRGGSETWWGVTQVQLGRLAIDGSAGQAVSVGSEVVVHTTLPEGTRVEVGAWYVDGCGHQIGHWHFVAVAGSSLRFPVSLDPHGPPCAADVHTHALAAPTPGFLAARVPNASDTSDASILSVRFVPVS
jgi:hypothetical protein